MFDSETRSIRVFSFRRSMRFVQRALGRAATARNCIDASATSCRAQRRQSEPRRVCRLLQGLAGRCARIEAADFTPLAAVGRNVPQPRSSRARRRLRRLGHRTAPHRVSRRRPAPSASKTTVKGRPPWRCRGAAAAPRRRRRPAPTGMLDGLPATELAHRHRRVDRQPDHLPAVGAHARAGSGRAAAFRFTHGAHQVAQKLSTSGLPRSSAITSGRRRALRSAATTESSAVRRRRRSAPREPPPGSAAAAQPPAAAATAAPSADARAGFIARSACSSRCSAGEVAAPACGRGRRA